METEERIEAVLEREARPMLRAHGGAVRLVEYRDGVAQLELLGACAGCPSADLSTRGFLEETLKAAVPEVRAVELFHPVSPELLDMARRILGRGEEP